MDKAQAIAAASVSCRALWKSYDAELDAHRWRHAVLRDLSLSVKAGRSTALVGGGLGPVTLLRCLAGLVTPDRGSVVWRAASGLIVPPPPRALVGAGWRPYACQTVSDVLQAAVPPERGQAAADLLVARVARRCALAGSLGRRVVEMPPVAVRLVATAAAVVAGARWLFLDRREAIDVLDGDPVASAGRRAGASPGAAPMLLEAAVLDALTGSGCTVVMAGPSGHCAPLAPLVTIALSSGRHSARREPGRMQRVAERQAFTTLCGGPEAMERELERELEPGLEQACAPSSGVVAPVATAPGPP